MTKKKLKVHKEIEHDIYVPTKPLEEFIVKARIIEIEEEKNEG